MKKMKHFFLIIMGCWFGSVNAQNPYLIQGQTTRTDLAGYLYTTSGPWASQIPQTQAFQKVENKVANFGFGVQVNWLKFELKNQEDDLKKMVLFLDQVFLQHADFYLLKGDTLIQSYTFNSLTPFSKRPFGHQCFTYPFSIQPHSQATVYLKIQAHPMHGIARALLMLYDESSFFVADKEAQLSFGIFMGFILLSALLGIILFVNSPKTVYVIYTLCILNVLAYYLCSYGYFNVISSNTLLGSPQLLNALTMSFAAFHLLLVNYFLKLSDHFSLKTRLLVNYLIVLLGIVFVAYLIAPTLGFLPLFSRILMITLTMLIVYLIFWSLQHQQKLTYLYIIASLPGVLLVFYFLLGAFNIISLHQLAFKMSFPVSVFEIVTYGFGLIYVFSQEKVIAEQRLEAEKMMVTRKIITAQEQERQRISQDLHDDLGSTLAILKNKLSQRNDLLSHQLDSEMVIAEKAVFDLRQISHNLMPTSFLKNGLKEAIDELVLMTHSFKNIYFMQAGEFKKMDWDTELSIFRIVKELITNAIKHAKPTKIEVQLLYFKEFLYVSVEDDGLGMMNEKPSVGIGLKNINLRVNYLKGKINLESSPKGTLITVEIPYEQSKNKDIASR